jgi:peptidoglycan/xylan/chitin deacetylase (PgdA/CDA1 family)
MLTIETKSEFVAEKEYCCHVLFREMLGIEYRLVWTQAPHYTIRVPDGGILIVEDHFFQQIPDGNYLQKKYLPKKADPFTYEGLEVRVLYGEPAVIQQVVEALPEIRCGVDFFASTYFMLTRWEEYVLPDRDEHGRFPARSSTSFRFQCLDRPIVNEWADLLFLLLGQLGWRQTRPERKFCVSVSCDVDHPRLWWSTFGRFKTLMASILRRKNPQEATYWLRHFFFRSDDPYDVFDEWLDIFERFGVRAQFNFLGTRVRSSDCYYPLQHPFVRETIRKIADRGHGIGFHPSYESYDQPELFQSELDSIRQVSPVPVRTGRQHYLRFSAPETWRVWESAGMDWDSTAGYSEIEGFRCGICHDFPVFDFIERKMLHLREKPLIAMDVTLAHYQRYSSVEATEQLLKLRRQVEKHQGEFVLLWHNSSWNTYFWAPWKEVFLRFIAT